MGAQSTHLKHVRGLISTGCVTPCFAQNMDSAHCPWKPQHWRECGAGQVSQAPTPCVLTPVYYIQENSTKACQLQILFASEAYCRGSCLCSLLPTACFTSGFHTDDVDVNIFTSTSNFIVGFDVKLLTCDPIAGINCGADHS